MKFINIRFFDGETATSESGAPEAEQSAEIIEQPTEPESAQDSGTTDIVGREEDDYAAFDRKSPLLRPGRSDEYTEANADAEASAAGEGQPAGIDDGRGTGNAQQPEAAPYRVLKYHGQEIPVQTEDDLMRLASQGLDYTRKTQRIAPYRALVERMEADPSLMARVAEIINGSSTPQPQPRQQRPTPERRSEQEPTPRDDETWDEFIARRDAWRTEHGGSGNPQSAQDAPSQDTAGGQDFMNQFNAAMEMREQQQTAVRIAQMTLRDPKHVEVLNVINSEVPKSMQDAMNRDPVAYQMIYDQIRRNLTGEMYFAGIGRRQQPQQQQQNAAQTEQTQPHGQVALKASSKPAPVVESGRGQRRPDGNRKSGTNGTDFWGMSDADFNNLMERTMSSR